MTGLQSLLLALCVLYLLECVLAVRSGAIVFRSGPGRKSSFSEPGDLIRSAGLGFVFCQPIPAVEAVFVCREPVVVFTPQAMMAVRVGVGGQVVESPAWPWTDVKRVTVSEKKVIVNGAVVATFDTRRSALQQTQQIIRLAAADANSREAEIHAQLKHSLDSEAIRERLQAFRRSTLPLLVACTAFFLSLVIPFAMLWVNQGISTTWAWAFLGNGVVFATSALILYGRALRALYPAESKGRHQSLWHLVLSPLGIVRLRDLISRDLLYEFHPIAVANVLAESDAYNLLARRYLVRAREAASGTAATVGSAVEEAGTWRAKSWKNELEAYLTKGGCNLSELLQAPPRRDPSSRTYCPLCLTEYTLAEGKCSDCQTVTLELYKS